MFVYNFWYNCSQSQNCQPHQKAVHTRDKRAARKAKMLELLQTAESGSVGSGDKVATQRDIIKQADVQTVQKKFDLSLEMGPYKGADYSI